MSAGRVSSQEKPRRGPAPGLPGVREIKASAGFYRSQRHNLYRSQARATVAGVSQRKRKKPHRPLSVGG